MSWFLVALMAPLLYTTSNYIDKYILGRFVKKDGGIGGVVIFSTIFGAIMVPISFLFSRGSAVDVPFVMKSVLAFNGAITISCLILYLKALQKYLASSVVPLYQLIPIFSYLLGYLVLGETLLIQQLLAGAMIIIGAFILSLKNEEGEFKINYHLIFLMGLASLLFALTGTVFKKIALETGYWQSQFWEYLGIAIVGILFFIFIKKYRQAFLSLYRHGGLKVLPYSSLAEICMIGGDLLFGFSLLLAPITLVYVVNSLQPLFILVVGLLLAKFLPRYYKESGGKYLAQKTLAIFLMVLGAIVLAIYS